jgi:hypothetical protein
MKRHKHGKKKHITPAQLKRLRAIRGFIDSMLKK